MSYEVEQIRGRLTAFEKKHGSAGSRLVVSVKVRVTSGCYCRNCSTAAWVHLDPLIDQLKHDAEAAEVVEHESGPEVLVYLALGTAVLTLGASVIDLVAAIINARKTSRSSSGDAGTDVEVVVRRADTKNGLEEEIAIRVRHGETVDRAAVKDALDKATRSLLAPSRASPAIKKAKIRPSKKKASKSRKKK